MTNRTKGGFNIEETRIRNSDDSGIPEDKNSSKSSSVSSSVSNLSSSSPILPDLEDKAVSGDHHVHISPKKDSKSATDVKQSQSDSSFGQPMDSSKGAIKNVDSVKLKQIARDNAVMNQQKLTATSDNVASQGGIIISERTDSIGNSSCKLDDSNSLRENTHSEHKMSTNHGQSSVDKRNPQESKPIQSVNRMAEMSQKSVSPNEKPSQSCIKPGSAVTMCSQDSAKDSNQGSGKPWNSSTNLKSINTRSGATASSSGNNSKPIVPVRPSVTPRTSTHTKDQSSPTGQVSNVIVEDLDSEQLWNDQEKCDTGIVCSSGGVNQVSKHDTGKVGGNKSTKSKPPGDGRSRSRAASNSVMKIKTVSNSVMKSVVNDKNVSKTGKNDTNVIKPKAGPISINRQANNKPQTSQVSATKPNPTGMMLKQNVPKTSDNPPVRPPRKSQIQKVNSSGASSHTKQVQTKCNNEKEISSKEYGIVVVEESKTGTQHQQTKKLPAGSEATKSGTKVEEMDVLKDTSHSSPRMNMDISHGAKNDGTAKSSTTEVCITSKPKYSLLKSSTCEKSQSSDGTSQINTSKSCEKSSVPNIKQIQVMPYQEQVAPSQHEGPVIVDIFESLRQERELAEQQQNEDGRSREKAAAKQKQVLYPKKTKTPDVRVTSAGGKTKRSLKSAGGDKNERQKRQQNKRVRKKKMTKKQDKEDLMLTDRPTKKEKEGKGSVYVSGKGWYIHTECNENNDACDVRMDNGSDDSDDDDTTWVQPNYISDDDEDDILRTSLQRNEDSLRHSHEWKSIPGQIRADDSEDELTEVSVLSVCGVISRMWPLGLMSEV